MVGRFEPRERPPDRLAPELSWEDFRTYVWRWKQNQHAGLVGPTEQGKTNLAYHLLSDRTYVTYFGTKIKDATLDGFATKGGYQRIQDWPPLRKNWRGKRVPAQPDEMPKRLLWPDASSLDSEHEQVRVFGKALDDIYRDGGWCTVLDDFWYLSNVLKFDKVTKKFLTNARSNDIPMLICAQRPAGNQLVELFDQSTHMLFFRDTDEPNLRRIAGVGYSNSRAIQGFVANLERFQFLYVNTRTGDMYRSKAPELEV